MVVAAVTAAVVTALVLRRRGTPPAPAQDLTAEERVRTFVQGATFGTTVPPDLQARARRMAEVIERRTQPRAVPGR